MKKNYGSMDDIEAELKNVGLENFLDFKANDDFEFAKCEGCDGPLLGHLEVKCTVKEGVRYGLEVLKTFENWLKRIPGFRDQLKARQQKKDDIRATKIGEYVKIVIETADKKNTTTAREIKSASLPRLPRLVVLFMTEGARPRKTTMCLDRKLPRLTHSEHLSC